MKFHVAELKENVASPICQDYEAKLLDVEFEDQKYTSPVRILGTVQKTADTLCVEGKLESEVKKICGRCLKENLIPLKQTFKWILDIADQDAIDLLPNIRELLVLDHSMVYHCRPECKGLCPQCGIDLNQSTCHCEKKRDSQPFHKLKTLKSKKEN